MSVTFHTSGAADKTIYKLYPAELETAVPRFPSSTLTTQLQLIQLLKAHFHRSRKISTDRKFSENINVKPVSHLRISPPLAKNFANEKVHLLFFRAVNKRSNRS
jgi:hypothetical protein